MYKKKRQNLEHYIESTINEENHLDHNVEGDAEKSSEDCVHRDMVMQVLKEMKIAKVPGPSLVSLELIAAREEFE